MANHTCPKFPCPICYEEMKRHFDGVGYWVQPTYTVQPCPSCASFRARLDREKLADIIGKASLGEAYCRATNDQELFYEHADAIIKYFEEPAE